MNPNTTAAELDLKNKTKAELKDLVNAYTEKHGPPKESYDGAKNTIFGRTEDGKGVWVLPASKANVERFEDIARSQPDLGHGMQAHCELLKLAGAEFFADWRDSDRVREAKESVQGRCRTTELKIIPRPICIVTIQLILRERKLVTEPCRYVATRLQVSIYV